MLCYTKQEVFMKKIGVFCLVMLFSFELTGLALAADQKAAVKAPIVTQGPGARRLMHPNFGIITGSIVKIDNSDPAKPEIEIKSDADNQVHVIGLTPYTNVTKVTDISELKAGEAIRVMARKVDDKEVALTIMFGKFKAPPMRPRSMQAPVAVAPPAAVKK